MYARQSSAFEEQKIDPIILYNELLKLQQEVPVVDLSFSTAFVGSSTHDIETSLFERKLVTASGGADAFIARAWRFLSERQVTPTATQSLYNEEFALDLLYSFNQGIDNFELEAIIKFKKFEHITDIYIEEGEQFINIKVFINLEKYDYDLMNNIFNDAEFPLKDKFERDKLFNFRYIYKTAIQSEFIEYLGKRVYSKS
jgi:hypothetical protein